MCLPSWSRPPANTTSPPITPAWVPGLTPWVGVPVNSWARRCAKWPRPTPVRHPCWRPPPFLPQILNERLEQATNHLDLILQAMIGIEQVQRRKALARPTDAVLDGHDVI